LPTPYATAPKILVVADELQKRRSAEAPDDRLGYEVLTASNRESALQSLIMTLTASEDRVRGITAGADDFLSKPPVLAELEARGRSLTRLKRYTDELDSAESVIFSLGLTIEARDPYTKGHCQRLAMCATALRTRLGLQMTNLSP
jgi:DNA-binding response OmpR family regulator